MYRREKLLKEEAHKPKKTHRTIPSFSSTLLDEIYRSIDEKTEDPKTHKSKKQSAVEDEETANFRRACLVEKWIEREISEKAKRRPSPLPEFDNDLLFFSSTSSSSDSSGQLSVSDSEFFGSKSKPKPKQVSCFSTSKPKPIRTSVYEQEDSYLFDDYKNIQKNESKNRALKIYANLKKVKQPISPGMKLTNFINTIFNNGSKKSKIGDRNVKSATNSTCSSASSFSRSCLSKYSPNSREKLRNGLQRTVRFDPVSVIVDQDSRACGQKSIYDDEMSDRLKRPPLPPNAIEELKLRLKENNRKVEGAKRNVFKELINHQKKEEFSIFSHVYDENDGDGDGDGDDAMSDCSSDLFELDNLSLIGNSRFCEELPVYETTRFNTNRAISSCSIR